MGEPRGVNEKPLCKILQKWKSLVAWFIFAARHKSKRDSCAQNDDQRQNREKKKKKKERKNTEP